MFLVASVNFLSVAYIQIETESSKFQKGYELHYYV